MGSVSISLFVRISRVKDYIKNSIFEDIHNLPLWFIAFYMFGVIFYFSLETEPSLILLAVSIIVIAFAAYYYTAFIRLLFLFFLSFLLGIGVITYKASTIEFFQIPQALHDIKTSGVIDQIYPVEKGRRLILGDVSLGNNKKLESDTKIQVMIRSKVNLLIGDKIDFVANLYPTKENFLPRGYDFARHSFFNKIAAHGYAVSKISVVGSDKLSLQNYIDNLRHYIFMQIKNNMPEKTGNVAAALMIGEQKSIDHKTSDDMRKSGLSHVLAVSGLHLSLLSIICFFVIRYFLSCSSYLCQYYNTKKIAAYFALIATFLYLLISGAHISAVRAFIMVALVTLAILIDREVDAKRSVCIAAFVILFFVPEALLTPSFQMSFAAVLALVSSYELYCYIQQGKAKKRNRGVLEKLYFYFFATAFSSLIAGSATAIFVIYTFNNYANYSVIANVLVAPIVSIVIMPMVVMSFILMPLKIHFVPLFFLDHGISWMLKIAGYVSSLPFSNITLPKPDGYIIFLFLLGFLWLCFWQSRWRWGGGFFIIISFVLLLTTGKYPDIILDAKNNIMLVHSGNSLIKVGKKRISKSYQRQLMVISDSQNFISEKSNRLEYLFKDQLYSVKLSLYSQPIFNIYQQIKLLDIVSEDNIRYSLDLAGLSSRGNCFIYLKQSHYDSECSKDNQLQRPWS